MNLLLTGSFDAAERDDWAAALRQALPTHRLLLARGEVDDARIDVAIVANPPPGMLAGLPNLRLIQSLWAGVDRLLTDATLPAGVPICRMVDPAMNTAMAETALWAVLSLHRGFFGYAHQQRAGLWLQQQGYPMAAWRRSSGGHALPGVQVYSGAAGLQAALAGAQVVVNLLPLTPDTHGLLNADLLARLPRGAALVNLARGAHVVDADLLAALASGQIGHAVLDVFATEPLPATHPYWQHPQVTVLPHVAALTDVRSAAAVVAGNITTLASGGRLRHRVQTDAGY